MTLANKILYGGIFVGAFGLGAVGELISPGHGRDVAYCFHSYSGIQLFTNGSMSPMRSAMISFAVQSAGEICQKYGLFPGTFDDKDFIAYVFGSALVFGTEKIIRSMRNNKRKELSDFLNK